MPSTDYTKVSRAVTRNLRVSPSKLNLLASAIRGMSASKALVYLEFSRKRISGDVRKTVLSAVANAENNLGLDGESLVVAEAYVGKNMVMKRWRARARGRVGTIKKPFSQITVVLREEE